MTYPLASIPKSPEPLTAIGLYEKKPNHIDSQANFHHHNIVSRVQTPPTPPPEHQELNGQYSDSTAPPHLYLADGIIPTPDSSRVRRKSSGVHSRESTTSRGGYTCGGKPLDKARTVEIAAKLTCLFWFESPYALHRISNSSDVVVHGPLQKNSFPTKDFTKWADTVISTTQVSQGVVLLSLLFIFRLKMLNPDVKGKAGSECRLLTIALMLGNKYLDDNTYTNKTWADVSGISVEEIHVMEVEFLSNMKYNLYTSEEQWIEWQEKIEKFSTYWELASQRYRSNAAVSGLPLATQTGNPGHLSLPSPPLSETQYSTPTSPVTDMGYTSAEPRPSMRIPRDFSSTTSNGGQIVRKRGREDNEYESQPKRVARPSDNGYYSRPLVQMPTSTVPPLQLEPPVRPITTYHYTQPVYLPPLPVLPSNAPPSLGHPGLVRPQSYVPVSTAPTTHNVQIPTLMPNHRPMNNRQTPVSSASFMPSLAPTAAPSVYTTSACSSRQTSPYGYNRASPYRPVREVNTLLIPPPAPPQLFPSSKHAIAYKTLATGRGQPQMGTLPYMSHDFSWPAPPAY